MIACRIADGMDGSVKPIRVEALLAAVERMEPVVG